MVLLLLRCRFYVGREGVLQLRLFDVKQNIWVHYHYHESSSLRRCRRVNKRLNLIMFIQRAVVSSPPSIYFHFTLGGEDLPSAEDFFSSVGMNGTMRSSIFPVQANVKVERLQGNHGTDLCPRSISIQRMKLRGEHFDYAVFLNDGTRGPFGPLGVNGGSAFVPGWLAFHVGLFHSNPAVSVVGSVMTCERDLHLQSWFLIVDWRSFDLFHARYAATCSLGANVTEKLKAIDIGEIGVYRSLFSSNLTIASIWPAVNAFPLDRSICFNNSTRNQTTNCEHWRHDVLYACQNPWLVKPFAPPPPEHMVFIKYGGEILEQGHYPQRFQDSVDLLTADLLGLRESPEQVCKLDE
eukprot:TRINITY_DN46559_c0_g1_i1.p1 TRINITY_DN46559_c0_g1~~TRINITY_DN46559_c0_g1_i1.p1  ORF type:complete len:397 (-),score=7.56 TRINITY_DN46559_c0_g1_i1:423-1475(-)